MNSALETPAETHGAQLRMSILERLGLVTKDVVTIGLALLAFLVSALTAYFTLFYEREHVSAVARTFPVLLRREQGMILHQHQSYSLVLINSGNRPVAVTSVALFFLQQALPGTATCDGGYMQAERAAIFDTNFEAVVLEPNKVVVRTVQVTGPSNRAKGNTVTWRYQGSETEFEFELDKSIKGEFIRTDVCLVAELSTPSVAYWLKSVGIGHYVFSREATYFGGMPATSELPRPQDLINKTKWFPQI